MHITSLHLTVLERLLVNWQPILEAFSKVLGLQTLPKRIRIHITTLTGMGISCLEFNVPICAGQYRVGG